MLAGHRRNHTAVVAGDSLQQQVLFGNNCHQQPQVGHKTHNSAAHSSAKGKEHAIVVEYNKNYITHTQQIHMNTTSIKQCS